MAKKASSRNAQGAGTIRKKTVTRNGKPYTYWEARYTEGRDPGTGKQVKRSIYGRTQKEVREKLQAVAVTLNTGTYTEPDKMTVGEWLDMWLKEYVTGAVKKPMKCLLLVILVARPLSVIIVVKVLVVMWVTKWKLRQEVLMFFVLASSIFS